MTHPAKLLGIVFDEIEPARIKLLAQIPETLAMQLMRHTARSHDDNLQIRRISCDGLRNRPTQTEAAASGRQRMLDDVDDERHNANIPERSVREQQRQRRH